MTTKQIGQYTIRYEPALEVATVTIQGFFLPEVVHEEDGPGAFDRCKAWIEEQASTEAR